MASEMHDFVGRDVFIAGEDGPWEVTGYEGKNGHGSHMFTVGLKHPDQQGQYRATRQYRGDVLMVKDSAGGLVPLLYREPEPTPETPPMPSLRESDHRAENQPAIVPFAERWTDASLERRKAEAAVTDSPSVPVAPSNDFTAHSQAPARTIAAEHSATADEITRARPESHPALITGGMREYPFSPEADPVGGSTVSEVRAVEGDKRRSEDRAEWGETPQAREARESYERERERNRPAEADPTRQDSYPVHRSTEHPDEYRKRVDDWVKRNRPDADNE